MYGRSAAVPQLIFFCDKIPDRLLEHDQKLVVLIRRSAEALAEVVSNEASHQQPGLVMRCDHGIAGMVRGTVVGNTGLASTRWKRLAPDSAPVLR